MTEKHEFLSAGWLDTFGAMLSARAAAVSAAVGPQPFTLQEAYEDESGSPAGGWYATFEAGRLIAFGAGPSPVEPDSCSTSPRWIAEQLAATVLTGDAEQLEEYLRVSAQHVRRTSKLAPELMGSLGAALGPLHNEIAEVTATPSP